MSCRVSKFQSAFFWALKAIFHVKKLTIRTKCGGAGDFWLWISMKQKHIHSLNFKNFRRIWLVWDAKHLSWESHLSISSMIMHKTRPIWFNGSKMYSVLISRCPILFGNGSYCCWRKQLELSAPPTSYMSSYGLTKEGSDFANYFKF